MDTGEAQGQNRDNALTDRPVVENMADTLTEMVGMGLSVGQIEKMLSGLGVDLETVRSECGKIVGNASISLQRQTSIGLELLRESPGCNDAMVAQVVASLELELEDPPERFRDPVSHALMNEPRVIETGHVFDERTVFDERGNFRFDACPMTRREIQHLAFPVVFLKKEVIEYKLRRLDAVLAAAGRLPGGKPHDALLRMGKALLDQIGSETYIHHAEKYWTLRVDSMEAGPELVEVIGALAAEETMGKIDASSPLRALFDGVAARLIDAGAATRRECDAMLVVYDVDKPPYELVDELDGKIREGEIESAKALARALVHRRDDLGFEVVLEATRRRVADVVRTLIKAGMDVNKVDNDGRTPLYFAALSGYEAVVKTLIEAGADVIKADNDGRTPLYIAAWIGFEAVVKMLIEAGADVIKADNDGRTPLHMVCANNAWNGYETVVRVLIQAGADVNTADNDGRTPLYFAAWNGYEAGVKMLIEAGADVIKADNDGRTPLYMVCANNAWNGYATVVRVLFQAGADVNTANDDGATPLYVAAWKGHEAVVRALIELGADINKAKVDGATPLYIASEEGHEAAVRALIELGADINKAKVDAATPLYIASEEGHEAAVRALIELGADINKAKVDGETPLYIASRGGHEAITRTLIEAGADVNKSMDDRATSLFIAAQKGHDAVVRVLIEAGADVNKAMNDGATPLFMAAQWGHEAVVRALIEASADVNKATDDGKTPLSVALTPVFNVRRGRHAGVVQMLRDVGAV